MIEIKRLSEGTLGPLADARGIRSKFQEELERVREGQVENSARPGRQSATETA